MAAITYICLFLSYRESLAPFSDEECGRILRAMLDYAATGEVPVLTGNERFIWPTLQGQMDRDAAEYRKKCEANRSNGQRGGRPKNRTVFEETDGFLEEPKKPKKKETENTMDRKNDTFMPADFERFWSVYPTNRGGREAACAAWKALGPDVVTAQQIMVALDAFKRCSSWLEADGRYIPSAEKFILERRWEKPPVLAATPVASTGARQLDDDEKAAIARMLADDDWGMGNG